MCFDIQHHLKVTQADSKGPILLCSLTESSSHELNSLAVRTNNARLTHVLEARLKCDRPQDAPVAQTNQKAFLRRGRKRGCILSEAILPMTQVAATVLSITARPCRTRKVICFIQGFPTLSKV